MAGIWFSISSSTLGILASRWVRTKLVSLNQEAPWPLDPLESSFHDHGMSELKPGTIELNLRNETVPMDRSHQKRNFPQQGSFAQISSTRQPKRNWRLEINPLTRALPFRHHTCKEVTTIGSVWGKPAAWSVLTWPACSIWGSGYLFSFFSQRCRTNQEECRGKEIDLQRNRRKTRSEGEKVDFFSSRWGE